MSDLPEINFKEKKEKKGFLPWFRSRLGFGGRSAIGGELPGAANLGRASLGAGKFGASSGIGGLLAGKAGLVLTAAVVAAALGTGVYMNNQPAPGVSTGAFSSDKAPADNYVPAILRDTRNQASSLDLLRETNKGAAGMDENLNKENEGKAGSKDQDAADGQAPEATASAPEQNSMAQELTGKLAAGNFGGGLSSSMGGGDGKFSGMGGFWNKFNSGAVGPKAGLSSLGGGFQSSPRFDQRKKLLAMKGSSRPVFSRSRGLGSSPIGRGSYGQAKGVRATQRSNTGRDVDSNRSTQDRAWEGSTGDGSASSAGAGVSPGEGGSGIVTSPSLDNTSTGGGGGTVDDPVIPDVGAPVDVSPWQGLPQQAMMYIMLSAVLSMIGGILIGMRSVPYIGMILYAIGMALCAAALALGAMALMIGIKLMSSFGQGMLGTIYTIGGGVAMAAAGMAMAGKSVGPITPMWMAGIAGILGLLGSMAGGK
ncbi:MAG: hypothetical protein A2X28_10780 [Elusimicrobia bacterium GWA2_56_46]|nr:MAG: hypothetical protein A2X28_10780 [Elusimicrobia bacterium GWA2_56_46]OGR55749.1 MAG: hypothetical protein A2X39_10400 [Elusimicrobia bacterium GWC2_56_31]HBB66111.1 hypothetical protein [Elusimicrobiota bacterium]